MSANRAIDTIFHHGKIAETYNIGGFNEWKNIDIIKIVINTVDRLLGRKEGEDMDLIIYVTDRLGHDARCHRFQQASEGAGLGAKLTV